MSDKMALPMMGALCDNYMGWGLFLSGSNLFVGNVILPSDVLYNPHELHIKGIELVSEDPSQRPCPQSIKKDSKPLRYYTPTSWLLD